MKFCPSRTLTSFYVGVGLLTLATAAHAAVGAKVLVQEWSPLKPKEQTVKVLADDPSVVSDSLQKAWSAARPKVCARLLAEMGKGGAAGGQTLRNIECLLDEKPVLNVASAGSNALKASLAIGGYFEATSTTPTVLGKYADPRFSIVVKANMVLGISVQANPEQTLRIDSAKFSLSGATIDSHNPPADILKFVADDLIPYFGGPNYKNLAETAVNAANLDLTATFNSALAPVNAMLRTPSGLVRVGVWGKPDRIVIAFGARELTPPAGGTMSGRLHWDTSRPLTFGNCENFSISATVQTGPAPLRDPGGYYESGDAPMRKVGNFQLQPGSAASECRYRITGLAAAWPNEMSARGGKGAQKAGGSLLHSTEMVVTGEGWDGKTVVPQPSAERNYVVEARLGGGASTNAGAMAKERAVSPGGPVINPGKVWGAVAVTTPRSQATTPQAQTPAMRPGLTAAQPGQRLNEVGLNPQPLPPKASPFGSAPTLSNSPLTAPGAVSPAAVQAPQR